MQTIDLSECENEPIRVPGLVQPHGVLLVVDPRTDLILQAGGDAAGVLGWQSAITGCSAQEVIGQRLEQIVEQAGMELGRRPVSLGRITIEGKLEELTMIAHEGPEGTIVELQPAMSGVRTDQALARIRAAAERMEAATDILEACNIAANEIHSITGYDRVMVYQFLPDESGAVIAERRDARLPPFLNHRYPASDIPAQARELYRQNPLRLIPDVGYTPHPVLPELSPVTGESLDMSFCALRSVSPIHIQYLKNMDVGASMSVSLLVHGKLWGLIACTKTQPKRLPYEVQEICAHLGQILSREIRVRNDFDRALVTADLDQKREAALRSMEASDDPVGTLLALGPDLQQIVRSHGMAVIWQGALATDGFAPTDEQVRALAIWLKERIGTSDCYATDRLSEEYPDATAYASDASGLIAIVMPGQRPFVLVWFRVEQVEEVDWAGNPHKAATRDPESGILNPRQSFDIWKETVRGRSRPWEQVDIESAEEFGRRATGILQQRRILQLNQDLEEANTRLASIATTDSLTGIANRRAFDERLTLEWKRAQRTGGTLALIILDVDFFKSFNDRYGHLAGDECLRRVAGVLGRSHRSTDLVARIGGEEFAVLLPDSELGATARVAETIRREIEMLGIRHAESPMGVVTASLGYVATNVTALQGSEAVFAAADAAVYEAKRSGRNTIRAAPEPHDG